MDLKVFTPNLMAAFCSKYSITGATLPAGFNVATITDTVFLMIEKDRDLMSDYLHTVAERGDLRKVNNQIARAIKRDFGLKSAGKKGSPNSFLIESFEEFRLTE